MLKSFVKIGLILGLTVGSLSAESNINNIEHINSLDFTKKFTLRTKKIAHNYKDLHYKTKIHYDLKYVDNHIIVKMFSQSYNDKVVINYDIPFNDIIALDLKTYLKGFKKGYTEYRSNIYYLYFKTKIKSIKYKYHSDTFEHHNKKENLDSMSISFKKGVNLSEFVKKIIKMNPDIKLSENLQKEINK